MIHPFTRKCRALATVARVCAALSIVLCCNVVTAAELNEPPVAFESQDIRGWAKPLVPKAALARSAVATLYHSMYLPGATVPLTWTGSVSTCNPGTSDALHQQAVIDRVNYFRALAGLPPVALLTGPQTSFEQAAALMMSANNALSHSPPTSWLCYSADGASGAGASNIALGLQGVAAVDLFMDDPGNGNNPVGHRRWVLFPPRAGMATGDVAGGNTPPRPANALYVIGPSGTRPATPSGTAWPPAGYVPYQNLPSQSNRWSFSFPGADFTNAVVTMTGPAGAIAVTYELIANGFGDNTIVFLPAGMSYPKPAADASYTITVSGMTGPGVPAQIQYTTTVIDPDASAPPPPLAAVDVVEFYNASLDHYFITSVPGEIANLDAGHTPTRWVRTGYAFKAYTTMQAGASPVCRFYIPPVDGDSHFFGRGTAECNATGANHPDFVLEQSDFMYMFLPVAGNCPAATVPIYRAFSNRPDANHRYMTDAAVRDTMAARGWLPEGDGPNLVVMCAPA